jgi:signal transduction histidine kinase/ligand-binding sensor domain-containing protein
VVLPESMHKARLLNLSLSRGLFYLFVLAATAWAVDPSSRISQYGHTAWRVQDGVVSNPGAITQTTDGYIWMRMAGDLVRFDGVKFTPWAAPKGQSLVSDGISALLGGRDGSLWIGTYGGLSRLKDGVLFNYKTTPNSPGINEIIEDHAGTIWVTRYRLNDGKGSLCQVEGEKLRCYGEKDGSPGGYAAGLAEDSVGNIWFGCQMLCRWAPGSHSFYFKEQLENPAGGGVRHVAAGPSGSVFAGLGGTGPKLGVQYYSEGKWASYVVPGFDGATVLSGDLYMDRNRSLWVGTESQGLYRIHDGIADHYGSANGLSGDSVEYIYEDREGNLWVTTDRGVDMFRDLPVVTFSTTEGSIGSGVRSVLALTNGSVWIGNDGAVDIVRAGRVSAIAAGRGLPGSSVGAMFRDDTGQIWLGVDNTIMTYKLGRFSAIKNSDVTHFARLGNATAFAEDTEGNIWALTHINVPDQIHLLRIKDQNVEQDIRVDDVIRARYLAADRNAGVWLASGDGKFVHYRDGKAEAVISSGREDIVVKTFSVDSDNAIWLATSKGLYRWKDGRMSVMDARNGLPCSSIISMIKDNYGYFWLYGTCGLLRVPASDWETWQRFPDSKVSVKTFDTLDGAQPGWGGISQPHMAKSVDGKLWFTSGDKVQMIDPSRTYANVISPPVFVEEVIADRKNYLPGVGLRLPPLTRDLEIDYTALSFVVPQKVRFRYKLEGRDTTWQEPGTRRQAFYSDLRPRKYCFRVIACNNDGLWNETGASLDFSIAPAYYQTVWFGAACAAAFLLLLWMIYQLRVQQLRRQFKIALEARVNERTRIARELHDTLLQSFHGLVLRFQAASNLLPTRPDDAKNRLDAAIDQSSQAIAEGRDAVQGLRFSILETNDLAVALRILGEDLLGATKEPESSVFDVAVEGKPRPLRPLVRDEVYRISAEALRNAFRHARAKRIEAEIRYGADEFRVRIRDDGKGIDAESDGIGARHFGLSGMRERAKVIDANLDVWSSLDSGTEVQLTMPALAAYESSEAQKQFRFFQKRKPS